MLCRRGGDRTFVLGPMGEQQSPASGTVSLVLGLDPNRRACCHSAASPTDRSQHFGWALEKSFEENGPDGHGRKGWGTGSTIVTL